MGQRRRGIDRAGDPFRHPLYHLQSTTNWASGDWLDVDEPITASAANMTAIEGQFQPRTPLLSGACGWSEYFQSRHSDGTGSRRF